MIPIRTAVWPTIVHRCTFAGRDVTLRFAGACRSGATASCAYCGQAYEYEKPTARRGRQDQGGRDHF